MKCEADEPLLSGANRCSTPQPSANTAPASPVSPDSAPQAVQSFDDAANKAYASAPPLSFSLSSATSRRPHSRPLQLKVAAPPKKRMVSGALPLKRTAPGADAFGFTRDDATPLIHDFKRDSFDSLYLEHQELVSTTPQRASIIKDVDSDDVQRSSHQRTSSRLSVLDRSLMTAALAKAALPAPSSSRQVQAAQTSSSGASFIHPGANDRDLKMSEWREKDKLERVDYKAHASTFTAASAPSPSAADAISPLQPSLSINLYPGGFSIDGRPSAHVYEAAHIPLLRSIGAGKLPVGTLLDVPNTEHLRSRDACCCKLIT